MSAKDDKAEIEAAQVAMEQLLAGKGGGQEPAAALLADPPPNPGTQPTTTNPDGGQGAKMAAGIDPADLARIIADSVNAAVTPLMDEVDRLRRQPVDPADETLAVMQRFLQVGQEARDRLVAQDERARHRREVEDDVRKLLGVPSNPALLPPPADDPPPADPDPADDFIEQAPPGKKEYNNAELINYYRKHRKMPDDWHPYPGQLEAIKDKVTQLRRGVDDGGYEEWSDDAIIAHVRKHREMPKEVVITEVQADRIMARVDEAKGGRTKKRTTWRTPKN